MDLADMAYALVLIGLLLLAGKWIRSALKPLRRLYLPSSIIAGALALLLGPQALGWALSLGNDGPDWEYGLWNERVFTVWSDLPSVLISVVFASLFIGKSIPPLGTIWRQAGPMVTHGQTLAWGQYVVGILLVVLLLTPVWGISPMAGALIEIGFEGGHGTAAGLADTFRDLGFENGADLALGLATIGVVMGVILGTALINWGVAKGYIDAPGESDDGDDIAEHECREGGPASGFSDKAIDPMSIHFGLIALAIGVGWLILQALTWFEARALVPLGWPELMPHIPLFPLAMIGGVVVQVTAARIGLDTKIDRAQVNRMGNTALDVLIVAALGTLSLAAIGEYLWPFVILAIAGIAWNLFGFLVLAPRMFPKDWFQNGLANFGQGIGMTVVGLLLVRMSDPKGETKAMDAFAYKQLLFEPVVGGGLFTAASVPLIAEFGPLPVLTGVGILMVAWFVAGVLLKHRHAED